MARVLGEPGRYVSQQAVKKRHRVWTAVMFAMLTVGILAGFFLGNAFRGIGISIWTNGLIALVLVLPMVFLVIWSSRKLDQLERERMNLWRGAAGETSVAITLSEFPDEFWVINDLTTPYGNLDHVVIGPTGVFVLDTKNWRGVVAPDGHGELLCNGKPLDKPHVRRFTGKVMGLKDRVKALANGLNPYFQPVFVFTSARVEANWGTTRSVHCIRDEQLNDYIVQSKPAKKLAREEVDKIAQAFLGLAHMDADFTQRTEPNGRPPIQAIVSWKGARANPSTVSLTPNFGRSRN
jgi:hypothetical protein